MLTSEGNIICIGLYYSDYVWEVTMSGKFMPTCQGKEGAAKSVALLSPVLAEDDVFSTFCALQMERCLLTVYLPP